MSKDTKKNDRSKRPTAGRYTPPKPKSARKSPRWYLWLIFAPLLLGALLIVVNFLSILPGGESTWYLLAGMALMGLGFAFATKYR
ncbi:Uncharacterised protein family (UPF0233) [Ferrithrix thermotolerans DSM 19514]|uniref:Uncharacterized protein family (UPF0233) n=1 Tax=Ferrithrix thermotolerans DSM 19514 TaxID=1121881 RepID=A0A1M4UCM0_9ACTN|nr:Uncharacterised protein family (UPF0233) [Ferrithrix thermotolerans DSM 19514]